MGRFDRQLKMQALHDVVKAGYVRYIGMSSCFAYQCKAPSLPCRCANTTFTLVHAMQSTFLLALILILTKIIFPRIDYAIQNKLTPFISMQNHYSLIYREEEREMFPTLKVLEF